MAESVGLVGLGLVGSALAERLLNHGFKVVGYDIDPEKNDRLNILGGSAVPGVAAVDVKGSKMIQGDFTAEARIAQHLKDIDLMMEQAGKTGQEFPFTRTHSDLLLGAIEAGDGDLDNSAIIREIRRRRIG
jgi:3-hydroxyisobutyrate dehydrogenase-like beta-hydroxyacid dehydrogenase